MRFVIVVCAVAVATLLGLCTARAAVFTVTSTVDDVDSAPGDGFCAAVGGGCTLRAAVQEANVLGGADSITVPAGTYTLTIAGRDEEDAATGDLDITGSFNDLSITGAGSTATIIDADGIDRVFHVCPTGFNCVPNNINITDLEITGGDPLTDGGGGVRNRAILTLTGVLVADNVISVACGAGIDNTDTGTLAVIDSTIRDNTANSNGGGGVCNHFGAIARMNNTSLLSNHATGAATAGGGAFNGQTGELSLTNCTISGNTSDGPGGGIFNYGSGFSRTTLNNVTVTNNSAGTMDIYGTGGGGVANQLFYGYIFLRNTIIAGNSDAAGTAPDCGGTLDTVGYNLIQSTTGCAFSFPSATDILGVGAGLDALQNNGGPTATHALQSSSLAVNGGNPAGCEEWRQGVITGPLTIDQRAIARPQGAACDIGAFERVACGDGTTGPGEQCDDGNTLSGDCCDALCQLEDGGSPCSDGSACTTNDACDGAATCVGGPPPNCDDSDPCTRDSCAPASGCVNAVPTGCRTAQKSILLLKNNADDGKDAVTWKWIKGAATMLSDLGTPASTTNYTLCLRAGSGSASIDLPAGAHWVPAGSKAFKYDEPTAAPDGAQKAKVQSGAEGKAKAQVKGKGTYLPDDLTGVLPLPVTVQLVNDTNLVCYESIFDMADVLKNDGVQFKAKR